MGSQTNYIQKEHSIADSPSGNMGTSKDDHAPVGFSGSWLYRELMTFSTSGPPAGSKIVSCKLMLKTTSGVHFQHGSSPRILIHRLTQSYAASGGGTETWRTDANPVWSGPTATSVGEADVSFGGADNYVRTFDITDIYEAICSQSLFKRNGQPAGGETNYGIRLRANVETSSTNRVEFHSMRGSYAPRVVIEWEDPPTAKQATLVAPLGTLPTTPTVFSWIFPAGDTATKKYRLDIGDAGDFIRDHQGTATPGTQQDYTYTGFAMLPGQTIPWTVWGINEVGELGPAAYGTFYVPATPTAAISHPPNNGIAETWNLQSDLTLWASSEGKARLKVLYTHPSDLDSATFEVEDNGVVVVYPIVAEAGTVVDIDLATGWVRNVNHNVRVRVTGSGGSVSAWSAMVTCRIQWAQGMFNVAHASGSRDFAAVHGALTGGGKVAYLYRNTAVPGSWFTNVDGFAKGTSLDMLIRLSASNTTDNPTLPSARIEWYGAGVSVPDFWTKSPVATLTSDKGFRRFGVHSAHMVTTGAANLSQNKSVIVTQGTKYTLSAYISLKTTGVNVHLRILDKDGNAFAPDLIAPIGSSGHTTDTTKADDGWKRIYWTFTAPAGEVRVAIYSGAACDYWVDAIQLEEGEIAAGWKPGNAGPAVIVDVGGIAIDATFGGIFRVQGSSGGARDRIELYQHGYRYGGDTELSSPSTGVLAVNAVPISLNTHVHPTTVVGAGTRNLGTATAAALNVSSAMPFGAPSGGEDPYGFFLAGTPNKLKIPTGLGGIYTFDVYMTGSVPTGNPVSTLAYMVCNLICALPTSAEVIGRWDRYESAANQGGHFSVTRPFAAGEELSIEVIPRIVVGSGTRVAGWNIYRIATGL